jgi:hypothetical protein
VTCACFGGSGEATLGWRQVALAPVWVAAGVLLARTEPVAGRTEWWALLAALGACLAWHLYPLAIGARDLRHDRIVRNNAVNAVVRRPVAALAAGRPDGTAGNQESP